MVCIPPSRTVHLPSITPLPRGSVALRPLARIHPQHGGFRLGLGEGLGSFLDRGRATPRLRGRQHGEGRRTVSRDVDNSVYRLPSGCDERKGPTGASPRRHRRCWKWGWGWPSSRADPALGPSGWALSKSMVRPPDGRVVARRVGGWRPDKLAVSSTGHHRRAVRFFVSHHSDCRAWQPSLWDCRNGRPRRTDADGFWRGSESRRRCLATAEVHSDPAADPYLPDECSLPARLARG